MDTDTALKRTLMGAVILLVICAIAALAVYMLNAGKNITPSAQPSSATEPKQAVLEREQEPVAENKPSPAPEPKQKSALKPTPTPRKDIPQQVSPSQSRTAESQPQAARTPAAAADGSAVQKKQQRMPGQTVVIYDEEYRIDTITSMCYVWNLSPDVTGLISERDHKKICEEFKKMYPDYWDTEVDRDHRKKPHATVNADAVCYASEDALLETIEYVMKENPTEKEYLNYAKAQAENGDIYALESGAHLSRSKHTCYTCEYSKSYFHGKNWGRDCFIHRNSISHE